MSETVQEVSESDSKKRKADASLSDLKRQQLAEARQRKAQKAAQREQELQELKSRISQTESKLNETESKLSETNQKIVNVEIDKQVQSDMLEKKQKIVTATVEAPVAVKKTESTGWNFSQYESTVRNVALVTFAIGSYYVKNHWRAKPVPPVPTATLPPPVERQRKPPTDLNNLHKPLSSLFQRVINADNPNNCQFLLQDTVNASRFELTNLLFANTLYNVTSYTNTLYIDGTLAATIIPGFWNNDDFVVELNSQLQTFFSTVSDVVTLDSTTNGLSWVLPSGSITTSPMSRVLGIIGYPTASFTTNLFLVGPMQLAFNSPQLQSFSYNNIGQTNPVSGVIPVTSGNQDVQFFEPFREWQLTFEPRVSFNLLQVTFTDNRTGNLAEGLGEWCAVFVVS